LSSAIAAPDLIVPVVGFRQWRLADGCLHSPFAGRPWPTAEQHAICQSGRHVQTNAPAKACSCGIYAWYSPCPLLSSVTRSLVAGAVILWGRIELHATGMRAAHARIIGLELSVWHGRKRRELERVANQLAVPVVAHVELGALAGEHGLPITGSLRPAPS
jgi:hypothetical protein